VIAYTEKFYYIASQCNLSLTEKQQTAKYIDGLKYPIQERLALQDLYSIETPFKNTLVRTTSGTRT